MLAIFLNLLDRREALTADVYTQARLSLSLCVCIDADERQVSSLVSLGLLSCVSAPGMLDEPRYRCNMSAEAVEGIAQHLGFPLHKYLAE
jgi:hypothetical protein